MSDTDDLPIACKLAVFTPEERTRHHELGKQLIEGRQSVRQLDDGWALELSAAPGSCRDTLEFALLERRCCPFVHFSLEIEPAEGPLWLRLTGRAGVKQFLESTPLVR